MQHKKMIGLVGLALAAVAPVAANAAPAQASAAHSGAAQANTARSGAAQADRPIGQDATIPFINIGQSIRNWQPDGTDGLYIQDTRRNWYRASIIGPCTGLPFAQRIGFITRGMDQLDRFSAILVDGERCTFSALVTSNPPPPRQHRNRNSN